MKGGKWSERNLVRRVWNNRVRSNALAVGQYTRIRQYSQESSLSRQMERETLGIDGEVLQRPTPTPGGDETASRNRIMNIDRAAGSTCRRDRGLVTLPGTAKTAAPSSMYSSDLAATNRFYLNQLESG